MNLLFSLDDKFSEWEPVVTERSRSASNLKGFCVPAVKKVRELSSHAFPHKLNTALAYVDGVECGKIGRNEWFLQYLR
jgi:hypothetical protein